MKFKDCKNGFLIMGNDFLGTIIMKLNDSSWQRFFKSNLDHEHSGLLFLVSRANLRNNFVTTDVINILSAQTNSNSSTESSTLSIAFADEFNPTCNF